MSITDTTEKRKVEVAFSEEAKKKLSPEMQKSLASVLKEDPRPAYQEDPEREYIFSFANNQIHFKVSEEHLLVTQVD